MEADLGSPAAAQKQDADIAAGFTISQPTHPRREWREIQKQLVVRIVVGLGGDGPVLADIEQPAAALEASGNLKFSAYSNSEAKRSYICIEATLFGHPSRLLAAWLANGGDSQIDVHWGIVSPEGTRTELAAMRVRDLNLRGAVVKVIRDEDRTEM